LDDVSIQSVLYPACVFVSKCYLRQTGRRITRQQTKIRCSSEWYIRTERHI